MTRRLMAAWTQGWWAPLAVLLSACEVAIGVAIVVDQQNPGSIVGGALHVGGALAIVVGLLRRHLDRRTGNILILAGAFWGLPLIWLVVPPVLAVAVAVGVITSGISEPTGRAEPDRDSALPG